MKKENIGQAAFDYYNNGYNCAEAMVKVLNENFGDDEDSNITKFATAFGGGMGRTHEETCGALNGAILFLGSKYGRVERGSNIDKTMDLAAKFREKFIESYSCTQCKELLENFGPQENSIKCKKMVSSLADQFVGILKEHNY